MGGDRYAALLEFLESDEADLSDVAALKLVQVTRNMVGRRVVCLFMDALLPEITVDKVLMYLVFVLDQVVAEPFHAIFFNTPGRTRFSMGWLWQALSTLPDKYHDNLGKLYFVHPTEASRLGLKLISPFISAADVAKLVWVDSLAQLQQLIGISDLPIPDTVTERDSCPKLTPRSRRPAPGDEPCQQLPLNSPPQFGPAERQLIVAATLGDPARLREQLAAGANINVRDGCGFTPTMLAARAGQLEIVEQLIEHQADLTAINFEGVSAMQLASRHGE